jgi:hypothetical protein
VVGLAGELWRLPVERAAGKAGDTEQPWPALLQALLGPVERGALRVGVDQRDPPLPGPFTSEMRRERRLADAALLVEECHDHRCRLPKNVSLSGDGFASHSGCLGIGFWPSGRRFGP